MKKYFKLLLISLLVFLPLLVKADPEVIELNTAWFLESEYELTVGEELDPELYLNPVDFTENLVWTSSDEAVASIDEHGHVTALSPGTTTIKMKGETSEVEVETTVKVYPAPTGIDIIGLSRPISINQEYLIEAAILPEEALSGEIEWDIDGEGYVTSDSYCAGASDVLKDNQLCIRLLEEGEYTVSARLVGTEISNSVTFTASKMMNEIYISFPTVYYNMNSEAPERATVYLNETKELQLEIEGYPDDLAQEFVVTSDDTSVATVDNKGSVKFLKTGLVTITATSKDGNATTDVTIRVKETSPEITGMGDFMLAAYDGNATFMMWNPVDGATKYNIYRSTSKTGKYKLIKTINEVYYEDLKLECGKTYYYKIEAVNSHSKKTSSVHKVKVLPETIYMAFQEKVTDSTVKFSWYKTNATGYEIYRSTKKTKGFKKIKTITKNKTITYKDKKLKANTKYYYKIRTYKTVKGKKIYSKYSDPIMFKTAPAAPKVKVSTKEYDSLKVKVSESKGAKYYEIVRGTSKKEVKTYIDSINAAGTYVDEGLELGKTYYYKVRACNSDYDCGSYSKVMSAKVSLKKPTVNVNKLGSGNLDVSVTTVNGADKYEVYKSNNAKKGFKLLSTVENGNNTFLDTGKVGKTYYYKARAYKVVNGKKIYSSYSSVLKVKVK